MNAKEEKRAAFNEQMNEWVSRQGLWFQLRHAADGQTLMARITRLGVRLVFFLIVVALITWGILIYRIESDGFRESVQASLEKTLKGSECEVGSIRKDRELISIGSIDIKGGENSFFHNLKARQIRLNMGLADGLIGQWDAGSIRVGVLSLFVKAGGSSDSAAALCYNSLFEQGDDFHFERIEADQADVRWGYSENNRGSIRGSYLSADRVDGGWKMIFKGGTFRQNWLRDMQIEKMVVLCDHEGVHIQEAVLHSGGGTLSFQLNMGSGAQPQAAGIVTLQSMPIASMLPARFHDWIEGGISGKGTISGSTNSQEGIVMDIDLSLDDGDVMVMRDSLPLLSALSVVDLYNSYRKVSFTEGGCHIRTGGNKLEITQMNMRAGDLLHLAGNINVRPPTHEEIAMALNLNDVKVVSDIIEQNWKIDDEQPSVKEAKGSVTSVAEAAKGTGKVISGDDEQEKEESAAEVLRAAILAEQRVRRFGGVVRVGLKRDAFDKAEKLMAAYPVDPATGRIWLDAPLNGRLPTLTLELAERLYELGKNRR